MSRRKQARPIRHLETEDGVAIVDVPNGELSGASSETEAGAIDGDVAVRSSTEERSCGRCNEEFTELADFFAHKKECDRKAVLLGLGEDPASDVEDAMDDDDEEGDDGAATPDDGVKRLEEVRRQRQDAENNNSGEGEGEGEGELQDDGFPFPAPAVPAPASHVTLEALQNTKVAVAQFAATTMANNGDNAAALQELAVLQSTLFTLQHQQVMQLSLIQQLQSQLSITLPKDEDSMNPESPPVPLTPAIALPALQQQQQVLPKPSRTPTPVKLEAPTLTPTTQSIPSSHSQQQTHQQQLQQNSLSNTPYSKPLNAPSESSPPPAQMYMSSLQSMCSISSALADSIITNNDPMPLNEPNTLDMLQKRAQEVLDNASQGLLANNLADELAFRKSGCKSLSPYDSKSGGRNEPFFKHRCRYCGKVFGSDSALQIHIRSHTGERPFKCNVCGSRFTTKGNLKVHFQRHTSKFPHIKMNPNPVPEHLDKYHPPLLAQMGQSLSPGHSPHPHHPHSHHPPPPHPHHPFHQSASFAPTSIPLYRPSQPPHDLIPHHHQQQPSLPPHHEPPSGKQPPPLPAHPMFSPRAEQDMPENLSSKPQSSHSSPPPPSEHSDRYKREPLDEDPHNSEDEGGGGDGGGGGVGGRLSPKQELDTDHDPEEMDHDTEGCYDPSPYDDCSLDTARPGNTTCNICFKTFACNSALEIHFRSHTKERPFKCTVCDRGFSTKGNSAPLDAQSNRDCTCDQWRIQRGDSGAGAARASQIPSSGDRHPKRHRKRNGNDDARNGKKGGSSGNKKYSSLPPLLCNPGYAAEWNPLLGNMKQHMLTHKIRDMPSHLFENIKQPLPPPILLETTTSNDDSSHAAPEEVRPPPPPPPPKIESPIMKMDLGMKRSPPEGESLLPIPKRQPSLPKHLCHVCNKNFSSSSALQIHMRTHTGDKPFRCTVCQKAFTTKGNLKVHMGTHMWSNGASRRGRRMSLDLPPIPMTPKDSEFLQRRPDLFYPYLPAPFLNGMQQKLNEISVIQSVNSNNIGGLSHPSSKYASLLGFGGYCSVDKPPPPPPSDHHQRSQTNSPLSDRPPSSVSSPPPLSLTHHGSPPLGRDRDRESDASDREPMPRSMWDLHYERKPAMTNGDEPMDVSPSPPGHVTSHPPPPTPRSEGLAA